jgi:hypothetical protein
MEFGYKQLLGETIGFQARYYAEKAVYMVRNFTAGKTHDEFYPAPIADMHRGGLSRRYRLYRAGSAA